MLNSWKLSIDVRENALGLIICYFLPNTHSAKLLSCHLEMINFEKNDKCIFGNISVGSHSHITQKSAYIRSIYS